MYLESSPRGKPQKPSAAAKITAPPIGVFQHSDLGCRHSVGLGMRRQMRWPIVASVLSGLQSKRSLLRISTRHLAVLGAIALTVVLLVIDLLAFSRASATRSVAAQASALASATKPPPTSTVVTSPVPKSEYLPDDLLDEHRDSSAVAPAIRWVRDAAARSCSTSSVEGLSRQIIAQSHCIDANAFVAVGDHSNLRPHSDVFLYMTAPAKAHLLAALAANPQKTLVVNSALRTVAQQYLLSVWGKDKRCGIDLAAAPGESNHEGGLALDIADPSQWRAALQTHGFRWLGARDRVHFEYVGKGAASHESVDVMAFQRLWNANHPDDKIKTTGVYSDETEARLKRSPAAGFKVGPSCR